MFYLDHDDHHNRDSVIEHDNHEKNNNDCTFYIDLISFVYLALFRVQVLDCLWLAWNGGRALKVIVYLCKLGRPCNVKYC